MVFSVDTEEEAKMMLVSACNLSWDEPQRYIARELAEEQTMENLAAFSDRLEMIWTEYMGREL